MPEGSKISRLKFYGDLDEFSSFKELPILEGSEYLVTHLFEAGLVQSNGMGVVSLSWAEIESWLRVTQTTLSVWEILTIKRMSEVYAGELSVSTAKDCPAPYTPAVADVLVVDRNAVESKLKNAFASFKRSKTE